LGLITITRPTNILIVIALLFWGLKDTQDLKNRFQFIGNNFLKIILSICCFILVLFIQLSYWKYVTGHWIYFSYKDEGFNFLDSEIWKGLFSYRKGWFVYTPIAFFGILGFIFSYKKYKIMSSGLLLFFCLNIYVIFSWDQWYYGGGFGCRPLIDALPVLAFPLAALTAYLFQRKRVIKIFTGTIIFLLIALNLWQTYQYSFGTIPWDHNNREYYWRVFLKQNATAEDWKLIKWNE
jgi:fumarate reductase subunit D